MVSATMTPMSINDLDAVIAAVAAMLLGMVVGLRVTVVVSRMFLAGPDPYRARTIGMFDFPSQGDGLRSTGRSAAGLTSPKGGIISLGIKSRSGRLNKKFNRSP